MLAAASFASKRVRASELLHCDGRHGIVSQSAIALSCFERSAYVNLSRNNSTRNQVRSFVGVSRICTYPNHGRIGRSDGFSYSQRGPKRSQSLLLSIKGFLSDSSHSSSSSSLYGRVTRPGFPQPVSLHILLVSLTNAFS